MSRDTLANPLSPMCHLATLSRTPPPRVSRIIWMDPNCELIFYVAINVKIYWQNMLNQTNELKMFVITVYSL